MAGNTQTPLKSSNDHELAQNSNSLAGQRNDVGLPHFHPLSRDPPLRLFAIQVHLSPFRCAQLGGTYKHVRSQPQSGGGSRLTVVAINGSQQLAYFDGVDDGCVMRRSTCRKSANKIRSDIMLGATRRNRVAEHTSADFPRPVRGVDVAFGFYPLQYSQ